MNIKKKTVLNVLLIGLILSFFVTPLGDYSKELLNQWFATTPTIIPHDKRGKISDYNWRLKDDNWDFFSFEEAKGKVVFINFWASWHLPSRAQMNDIQDLYDKFQGRVAFYMITDQERELPGEFMTKNGYTFPVTYQILGEPSPIEILPPPGSYILDKKGYIAVHQTAISDWNNEVIDQLLEELLQAE